MAYDPAKHHRRSIRLRGHDYAGGGLYFVTICAHREFIASAGATCLSPVREIIAEEWRRSGEIRDDVFPGEFMVMPDHFHGLIRIQPGASDLGHVIGAFKAAVSRRIRRGDMHVALTFGGLGGEPHAYPRNAESRWRSGGGGTAKSVCSGARR